METYIVQKGETFEALAQKFSIRDPMRLRLFHNKYCELDELIDGVVKPGITLHVPNPDVVTEETEEAEESITEEKEPTGKEEKSKDEKGQEDEKKKEEREQEETEPQAQEGASSPHKGKHFIVQKGKAQCNQGNQFPQFKVSSHQKHYLNDGKAKADNLAVTESDLQFTPPGPSFGQCKLKPSSGGYLPCAFAPTGKWLKPYKKVKVMDHACITEISELLCAVGGKITVKEHGQTNKMTPSNVRKANPALHAVMNPMVDIEEVQEEMDNPHFYE